MPDHVLANFGETDEHHGDRRNVSFDGDVLSVELYNADDGYRTTHYRLTQVEQKWVEVEDRG